MISWVFGGAALLLLLLLFRHSCLREAGTLLRCCRRSKGVPQCVLLTGAAGGFGRAIAKKYVLLGCRHLALVDIVPKEKLEELRSELLPLLSEPGGAISVHRCDVSDSSAVVALVEAVTTATGGIGPDVLISNAGIVNGADIDELSPAQLERTFRVNVLASFHLCRAVLPIMKAQARGTLVFVSSIMGLIGSARLSDYCASKWALLGLVESLRLELQRHGYGGRIDTVAILPYAAATGMFPGIFEDARDRNWLRSLLFPLLTADAVAEPLVRAAQRHGDAVVTLPPLVYWMSLAVHALPVSWGDAVTGFFGGHHGMSAFKGQRPPANATSAASVTSVTSVSVTSVSGHANDLHHVSTTSSNAAVGLSEEHHHPAGGAGSVPAEAAMACAAGGVHTAVSGSSAGAAHCAACAASAAVHAAAPLSVRKRSASGSGRRWQR